MEKISYQPCPQKEENIFNQSALERYKLGGEKKKVTLNDDNKDWREAYKYVEKALSKVLYYYKVHSIDLVGSTAIEGLPAKPILDILIQFEDSAMIEGAIKQLEKEGFTYKGDSIGRIHGKRKDTDRHCLVFYDQSGHISYIHLHLRMKGYPDARDMLNFRKAILEDQNLLKEYKEIKKHLLLEGFSRREYTKRKTAFVKRVLGSPLSR